MLVVGHWSLVTGRWPLVVGVVGCARGNDGLCLFSVILMTIVKNLLFNCSATIVSNTSGKLRTFFVNTSSFICASAVRNVASSDTLVKYVVNDTLSKFFTSGLKHGGSLFVTNILFFLSTLNSCCPRFLFFSCNIPSCSLLITFGFCHMLKKVNMNLTSTVYPVCVTRVTPDGVHKALMS